MTDGKKINLSAMISSSNKSDTKTPPTETPVEEKKQETPNILSEQPVSDKIEKPEPVTESKKIDIKSLSASVSNEKKDDETSSQDTTQKNMIKPEKEEEKTGLVTKKKKVDIKNISPSISKTEKENIVPVQGAPKKEDIKIIENKTEIKEDSKEVTNQDDSNKTLLENSANNEELEEKATTSEIFKNYSSDFNGKAQGIIKEIKKLKNLRKTNPKFLGFIIIVTVIGISFLFYVDPKNHSYTNYKASILNVYNKQTNPNYQTNTHSGSQQEEDLANNTPKINWNDLSIHEWGFNLKIESQTGTGGTLVYKFEGILYTSKEDLDQAVEASITLQKTRRIKSVISENFKRQ
ncbi:hypothetical protein A9Q91_04945 [Candidatus Gracilibacteria bacterium 28_42_T64]|nr:hypothetical protein A9Q91_04945 [Candidatus Gracilibacteria bacterium 28_42_T64]